MYNDRRYRIGRVLGKGAFGAVYEARLETGTGFNKQVAVKLLHAHLSEQPEIERRLRDEARLLGLIRHDAILKVDTLTRLGDRWAVVMELVDGCDLLAIAKGGGMPVGPALELVATVAGALHAAWTTAGPDGQPLQLVHRDIKPSNLFLTPTGGVRVLDFGIARAEVESRESDTQELLLGSLPYMAPERFDGRDLHVSDVYALGVTLYEVLTGKRRGPTHLIPDQHGARVEQLLNNLPVRTASLDALLRDCLAYAPSDRIDAKALEQRALAVVSEVGGPSLRSWAADVVPVLASRGTPAEDDLYGDLVRERTAEQPIEETVPADAPRRSSRRWWAFGLLGVVGAVAAAGVVVALAGAASVTALWWDWEPALTGPPLDVVMPPVMDAETMISDLEPFRLYLQRQTGRPVELRVADTYRSAAQQLVAGEADLATLTPYLYVETLQANPTVQGLAMKVYDDATSTTGLFLVRRDSDLADLEAFRGRRVCFSDPASTTGYVLPRAKLVQAGLDPDTDIEPVLSGNHLAVMRDLVAGRCDVGATYDGAYQTADVAGVHAGALSVHSVTGRSPLDAICASPAMEAETVDTLREILLSFDPQTAIEASRMGEHERITAFMPLVDVDYDDLRRASGVPLPER